jgi:hypothetical protein
MTQLPNSAEEGAQQVARKASHDGRKTLSWTLLLKPLRSRLEKEQNYKIEAAQKNGSTWLLRLVR